MTHTDKLKCVLYISTLAYIIMTDERNSYTNVQSYRKAEICTKHYNKLINAIDILKLDHNFKTDEHIFNDSFQSKDISNIVDMCFIYLFQRFGVVNVYEFVDWI